MGFRRIPGALQPAIGPSVHSLLGRLFKNDEMPGGES